MAGYRIRGGSEPNVIVNVTVSHKVRKPRDFIMEGFDEGIGNLQRDKK